MKPDNFIAVFDSGVGGISVLRQLRKLMPGERYIYFGDSANAPYGSRPTSQVRDLTLAAAEKLYRDYPVKALVVACNTATSAAINDLRAKYPDRIIVGIEPALKLATDRHPGGRVGVMATQVTLQEEKFSRLLNRCGDSCTVHRIPAPGLVELIESDRRDSPEAMSFLHNLLDPYAGQLDALVLGCTHYPFVKRNIQTILGPGTEILHGGQGTARETRRRLEAAGLLHSGPGEVIMTNSLEDPRLIALSNQLLNAR